MNRMHLEGKVSIAANTTQLVHVCIIY